MKLDVKQEKTPNYEGEVPICHHTSLKQRSVGAVLALTFIILVCLTFSAACVYFIATRQFKQVKVLFKNDKCDDTSVQLKPESLRKILRIIEEDSVKDELWTRAQCSSVAKEMKFDCHPDALASEEGCLARGCCWDASSLAYYPPPKMPRCYYPQDYMSYKITSVTRHERGLQASLKKTRYSGFLHDVEKVRLLVHYYDHNMLRIQLRDADHHRYEVPLPNIRDNLKEKQQYRKKYEVELSMNGDLIVTRVKTSQAIFHANLSRLVFSDQFIQLSSFLPSRYIYGLGQHKTPLLHSTSWERLTLFNYGPPPEVGKNLYGSHPFYLALENNGKANGVLLFNSNPMDIILQSAPAITYRPIGGILDFFIFLGPSPENVIQQYTALIGRPFMPPYWSLGFHLCRYNYSTLENTIAAWNRTRLARIPFDTQWNDIDYMDSYNDFTYDKTRYAGLPEFVKELHGLGMHYMQILDPGVSNTEPPGTYTPFDEGIEMDVFVKNSSSQLFMGKVWNKDTTVFTDFIHPNGTKFWTKQFRRYHAEVEIDGAWIDMNEPTSFFNGQLNGCPKSRYNDPQYLPGGDQPLYTMTLCMTAKHYNDTMHYNVHNLYALSEAIATYKALSEIRKKRPFIISRSSSPGLGHYSGSWNGDIYSTWEDMGWTIPAILNFNMYGIPMTGGDICGFENNTNVELCARWMALGAYYPFSRNHNSNNTIDQDPVSLGTRVVTSARQNLLGRYFLLPHLYTLFFRSHVFGDTVARPLFFEYPHDHNTYAIDRQFLWGGSLLIIPVLEPNVTSVTAYFPEDVWYDLYTGRQYENTGINITLDASTDIINLAVRGGSILPGQDPGLTTSESRLNRFSLIVALKPGQITSGQLYWDDGDSIDSYSSGNFTLVRFLATHNRLFTFPEKSGYSSVPPLGAIRVLGCQSEPESVYANGKQEQFKYDSENKVLSIPFLNLSLLQENSIRWIYPVSDEEYSTK